MGPCSTFNSDTIPVLINRKSVSQLLFLNVKLYLFTLALGVKYFGFYFIWIISVIWLLYGGTQRTTTF